MYRVLIKQPDTELVSDAAMAFEDIVEIKPRAKYLIQLIKDRLSSIDW